MLCQIRNDNLCRWHPPPLSLTLSLSLSLSLSSRMVWRAKSKVTTGQLWPAGPSLGISALVALLRCMGLRAGLKWTPYWSFAQTNETLAYICLLQLPCLLGLSAPYVSISTASLAGWSERECSGGENGVFNRLRSCHVTQAQQQSRYLISCMLMMWWCLVVMKTDLVEGSAGVIMRTFA